MHSTVRLTLITLALGLSACTVHEPYEQPAPPIERVPPHQGPVVKEFFPALFQAIGRCGRIGLTPAERHEVIVGTLRLIPQFFQCVIAVTC